MTKTLFGRIVDAILLCLFLTCTASAQTIVTVGFSGTVTDPTGAIVPEANLTLTNSSTGESFVSTSTATGGYAFSLLKPGDYTLLQTENANIATTFDTRTVQNIPNPGNDITYVAQTAPGVSMNTTNGNGSGNFSAFGLPGTSNLFTVNGNYYNDPFLNLNNSGASNLLRGGNNVQDVAVVSNGYTGQYGRQAGRRAV